MNTLWPVALITFKEGIRNRAIYGIALFALLLLSANFLISGMIPQNVGKVAVDIALSTMSVAGLLLVLFVGINLMAKDMDKRTIYMVLARPISRTHYVIGKFLGMVALLMCAVAVLAVCSLLSVAVIKLSYPGYFEQFSWSLLLLAMIYCLMMLIVLTSVSFLFMSLTSTSFVTLVLTVIIYISGHALADVKSLVESPDVVGIKVNVLAVTMVQAAYYLFPNLSLFDIKLQASHGLTVSAVHSIWVLLYGAVYTGIMMTLAAVFFRKKEFP